MFKVIQNEEEESEPMKRKSGSKKRKVTERNKNEKKSKKWKTKLSEYLEKEIETPFSYKNSKISFQKERVGGGK